MLTKGKIIIDRGQGPPMEKDTIFKYRASDDTYYGVEVVSGEGHSFRLSTDCINTAVSNMDKATEEGGVAYAFCNEEKKLLVSIEQYGDSTLFALNTNLKELVFFLSNYNYWNAAITEELVST